MQRGGQAKCSASGFWSPVAARLAFCRSLPLAERSEKKSLPPISPDFTLALAKAAGADRVINTATQPDGLAEYAVGKGTFDVLYECTGVASALAGGISAMRPRGVIMQLGLGGDMTLPMMAITAKELDLRGSFRFHSEFAVGVELMRKGLIDVKPLITHTVPLEDALSAFTIASDRSKAMKAQIAFS